MDRCLNYGFSASNCLGDFLVVDNAFLKPSWLQMCSGSHHLGRFTLRQEGSMRTCSLRGVSLGNRGHRAPSAWLQAGATVPERPPQIIGLFNFANEKNNILFEEFRKDPVEITMFCCDYTLTGKNRHTLRILSG